MVPTTGNIPPLNSHPPHILEVQSSMCQISQPQKVQPIARWILEEGELLGVLVAELPAADKPLPMDTALPTSS